MARSLKVVGMINGAAKLANGTADILMSLSFVLTARTSGPTGIRTRDVGRFWRPFAYRMAL